MTGIHFNVDAAEAFLSQLRSRREALQERLRDEHTLYAAVFDAWKDSRGRTMQERLVEFTQQVESAVSDLDDLAAALQRQIGAAREYTEASETW